MRIPRDVSGQELCKALRQFGYIINRQKGSHIRLTTEVPSQHHLTVPDHSVLRIGTLSSIIEEVATHLYIEKAELVKRLFK